MFNKPTYREEVLSEMVMFKAKLLSIVGATNANEISDPTSNMVETVLNVCIDLIQAWKEGAIVEVSVIKFHLGAFEPIDGTPTVRDDLHDLGLPDDDDMPF